MKTLPYILIIVALLIAGGIYIDKVARQPESLSNNKTGSTNNMANLKNYGRAPEFVGINHWLNSEPLTMQQLKGKVVLVDFWTYSCINCIRTLPYVTKWYDTYKDQGLVVVGVHTPEFAFEKVTENVQTAIERFKIHYPVAQDNNFATWNAFSNVYWPAKYLVDQSGNIVYTHFGEGDYDVTENVIRQLLGLSHTETQDEENKGAVKSPEIYFGTARLQYLTNKQSASLSPKNYSLPSSLSLNQFALGGTWKFDQEKITLVEPGGKLQMKFSAGKIFMVAEAERPIALKITVDGKTQPDVMVSSSQLYTLFDSNDYKEHIIEIEIPEAGFQAFTFTFG